MESHPEQPRFATAADLGCDIEERRRENLCAVVDDDLTFLECDEQAAGAVDWLDHRRRLVQSRDEGLEDQFIERVLGLSRPGCQE